MTTRHTPIEQHIVAGRTVFVKRDDLYATPPAPPVAKLRGLEILLDRLVGEKKTIVGCFEARVSTIGHALAALCCAIPVHCVVAFAEVKGHDASSPSLIAAKELGAELLPLRSNVLNVCYSQARKAIEKRGGFMIPFGFECAEALKGVELEARTTPAKVLQGGTLVLCCGSGVTLAGLLRGLPAIPDRVVGVSSGRALPKIQSCLKRHLTRLPAGLELHVHTIPYTEPSSANCPFPSNPFYDLKAWGHLTSHLHEYKDPVLFWNVGA